MSDRIEKIDEIERIYRDVFQAIVDHRMLPGTQLKEDVLCDIYNVGRTRIRRVLARLAADHIVELRPHRGAFVAQPSIEEAREVFSARRLLEPQLAREAARCEKIRARRTLEKHLQREERARLKDEQSNYIRLTGEFHLLLAELAHSPIMRRFLNELVSRTSLIIAVYASGKSNCCELDEHRQLATAILDGDGDLAAELMVAHLNGIESQLHLASPASARNDLRQILAQGSNAR